MKNIETKTLVEIEGAVLTSMALERLRSLQANNNLEITVLREGLSNAVCWLALAMGEMNESDENQARDHMCFLSSLRNDLDSFCKP